MPKFHDHDIKYVEDVTQQFQARIGEDGNVSVDWDFPTLLDIHEKSVWCDTCGNIKNSQEYLDHGLSEDWQAY